MTKAFEVPGISSLASLDSAQVPYEAEPIWIHGIISPRNQNCWPGESDAYDLHCLTLVAWRVAAEPVVERELTLMRPIAPETEVWSEFPPFGLFQFRLLMSADRTRAILLEWSRLESGAEDLARLADEMRSPVTIETQDFGRLVYSRSVGEFEGIGDWGDSSIRIGVAGQGRKEAEEGVRVAVVVWNRLEDWGRTAEELAIQQLLPVKNSDWLADDESPTTPAAFRAAMRLESIHVSADGTFALRYDVGDLFSDHAIEVRGHIHSGPNATTVRG